MTNKIIFKSGEKWDMNRRIVTFWAEISGIQILCSIPGEVLQDKFRADFDDPIPAFNENRHRIEEIAKRLINEGRSEILITNDDVP